MPVGKLDTEITIQVPTESKSSTTGQMTRTWSDWISVWAQLVNVSSTENNDSVQITSEDVRQFRIRYEEGITTKMRIYVPEFSRYYDITGISIEGRRAYLVLNARSHNVNPPA